MQFVSSHHHDRSSQTLVDGGDCCLLLGQRADEQLHRDPDACKGTGEHGNMHQELQRDVVRSQLALFKRAIAARFELILVVEIINGAM